MKSRELSKTDTYKINYALLAAIMTILIFLTIFYIEGRLPGGENIFLYSNFRLQYAAFAKLFWRSLLSGEGIQYTFNISLGMPSIPLYACYSMSPFNILYVLVDHVELASVLVVALKLALSAYAFQRFSEKTLKNGSLSSVFFSVAYALNGYNLIFYYNVTFLDGVYMLPVIALLISEAVKEKRFVKLALAYAYLFIVQFYEGYIIGFFSLLYFVVLMITEHKKEWKKYIGTTMRFGISVIAAALLGAAFLYPAASYLLTDFGDVVTSDWAFSCNIGDIYKNLFMGQYQTMESLYPYIYCGIMTLYLVPCFFADRKIRKESKWIALTALGYLLVCSLWLPGYQFMHCFDVPDGMGFRFAYFYPFVLLAIGCCEWKHMDEQRPRLLVVLFVVQTACYLVLGMGEENITTWDKAGNIIFMGAFLILFLILRKYGLKKGIQSVILGIVCVELIINGITVVGKIGVTWKDSRETYQAFSNINSRAVDEIKEYDQGFYRIINKNPYDPNDTAMNDYYGMSYFSTMENVRLKETLRLMGYAVSPRIGGDSGGTPLTEMLLAQKYEILANSADYVLGRSDALWRVNENTLSLGYMVSDELKQTVLDSDNAFENLNDLVRGMTGQEIGVFIPYNGEVTGNTENMSVMYDGESFGMVPAEGMTEGSVIFRLEDDSLLPAYAYFSQEESLWLGESVYFESGEKDQIRLWMPSAISMPQIIGLDKNGEGKYYVGIYYDEDHMIYNYYKNSYFYCYDPVAADYVYELLRDHQMNILEMKGSDITAEIEVPSDRHILFTSIPYDDGWHVLADGEEAETIAVVNDTFLAVELSEGYHRLQFYYSSDTDRTGLIFSIVGIIVFAAMIVTEKRMKKKSNIDDSKELG